MSCGNSGLDAVSHRSLAFGYHIAIHDHRSNHDGDVEACCLLPQLEIIRLHGRLGFTPESFVTMITSRWRPDVNHHDGLTSDSPHVGVRLRVVDVEFNDAVNDGAAAVLKECMEAGLHFPQWLDMIEGPSFHIDMLGHFVEA
jgi:hypothetical protein